MRVYPNIPGFNNLGFNNTDNGIGYDNYLSLDLNFAAQRALDPRITFVRLSGATQIGSTGLVEYAPENIIRNSENLTVWNSLNSATVLSGILAPDNTNTAFRVSFTNSTNSCIYTPTDTSPVIGEAITMSFWAWSDTNKKFRFDIFCSSTQLISVDITTTSIPTRYSFTTTVPSNQTIVYGGILNASTGDSGDIYVWRPQLERHPTARSYNPTTSSVYYGPRLVYDPITGQSLGVLPEESRTNLVPRSEEFSDVSWSKYLATVSANVGTAPNGAVTADLIYPSSTGALAGQVFRTVSGLTSGSVVTSSVFVKSSGKTVAYLSQITASYSPAAYYNLSTGIVSNIAAGCTASMQQFSNGWWRLILTSTVGSGTNNAVFGSCDAAGASMNTANGTNGILAWGYVTEVGSSVSSYIPTTTASSTRAADVVALSGVNFSSWYNPVEGTFVVSYRPQQLGTYQQILQVDNGTLDNRAPSIAQNSSNAARLDWSATGTTQISNLLTTSGSIALSSTSVAGSYRLGEGASIATNGAVTTSITSITLPVSDRLLIGYRSVIAAYLNSPIARIRYYRRRLSDTTLRILTT